MLRRIPLVFLVATSMALAACSDGGGDKTDAGSNGGDAGSTADAGDAGEVDAGDGKCHGDEYCPDNQYCELASGECLDALPCTQLSDCEFQGDYCDLGGCFCDLERNGGTCRPRFAACSPCESDAECGDDPFIYIDYTATCREFEGTKVCLPDTEFPCPPAYVMSSDGTYCEPAGGSCTDVPACSSDADCDPLSENPVCNIGQGFCIPACAFDYSSGESDCAPGQVCHLDPRLLTTNNPNFGGGKCGAPCDGGDNPYTCADSTVCETDGDTLLVNPLPNRCRPPAPKCIRNADCPASPETHSNGYCDRATLECSTGCQRESDCAGGYKCLNNQCVEKTCIENGGATLACQFGFLCCGEAGGVSPCPTGVGLGQCYEAPSPPWCGDCATPGPSPSETPQGSVRPQPSYCAPVTGSKAKGDAQILFHSCDPADAKAACPRSWTCQGFLQFCETDADCGAGGACGEIDAGDYGKFKGCVCSDGKTCPSPSTCKLDDDGNPTYCEANWCDNLISCLKPPAPPP